MIVIASDIHLQVGGMFAKPRPNGLSTRAEIGFEFLDWLGEFCQQADPEALLIPGDIFTQKNNIPVPLFNKAYNAFKWIAGVVPIYAIPGNHDRYMKSTDASTHSLYTLGQGIDGFTVITDPARVTTLSRHLQLIGVPAGMALPAKLTPNIGKGSAARILMIHEQIIGASYPTGEKAEEGIERDDLLAYMHKQQIDLIVCGDIHKPQVVTPKGWTDPQDVPWNRHPRVVICGAPYQMDFGDEGQARGVWTWDNGDLQFIEYKKGPKFQTVTDENWDGQMTKPRKGKWFYRFRVSQPMHRESVEKMLNEGGWLSEQMVVEYSSGVGENQFTPTDIHNYRNLIGDYVMTAMEAEANKKYRKHAGKITALGLEYFDRAKGELEK